MEGDHLMEKAQILSRNGSVLFEGPAQEAVEWIMAFPVGPHTVKLEGTKSPMTIDEWLTEYDLLNNL